MMQWAVVPMLGESGRRKAGRSECQGHSQLHRALKAFLGYVFVCLLGLNVQTELESWNEYGVYRCLSVMTYKKIYASWAVVHVFNLSTKDEAQAGR